MKIALLGYGVVGKGVEQLALKNKITIKYILRRNSAQLTSPIMTTKIDDIIKDPEIDCVIECMGGLHPAYDYVSSSLRNKKHVVTANKKMLAHYYDELVSLAKENDVSLLFSASCGGGIPWIKELSSIAESDEVTSFMGIMNGTSNYILDSMYEKSSDFDQALRKAQELGYAEADPSDDIDGVDTGNKVILSAGIAFGKYLKPNDLYIKGIRNFKLEDLNYCKDNGYKPILLGKGHKNEDGSITLSVMPSFVKIDSTLGGIKENYNCFILNSQSLTNLCFIGQGAGSLPTASNIIRDLMAITNKPYKVNLDETIKNNLTFNKAHYYISGNDIIPDKYVKEKLGDHRFITNKLSLDELSKLVKDDKTFIGEVIE